MEPAEEGDLPLLEPRPALSPLSPSRSSDGLKIDDEDLAENSSHHESLELHPITAEDDDTQAPLTSPQTSGYLASASNYFLLIRRNRRYRLYLISNVCMDVGDWFVKIGALLTIQRISSSSGKAISYLMLTIMLPQVFISPLGGALADVLDRRKIMIGLDILSGIVVLGYIVAVSRESVGLLYAISTLRTSLSSIYDPVTRSILPLIVSDSEDLKRAVTINYVAWSGMRIIGGLVAGYSSAYLGVEACFVIDSATFFISATTLCFLKGNYKVTESQNSNDDGEPTHRTPWSHVMRPFAMIITFGRLTRDLFWYLWVCGFGLLTLLRSSGSAVWGWADVLNVAYTHVDGNEEATSRRLGILFACLGVGCLLGPIGANFYTDPSRPATLQLACIVALAIMTVGWIGLAHAPSFGLICTFSSVRTFGAAILITNSTLLLQRLSAKEVLGRVLAFEFASSMGIDSLGNVLAGHFQDAGYSKEEIASLAASVGGALFGLWGIYHMCGGGAAGARKYWKLECFSRSRDGGDYDDEDGGDHDGSKADVTKDGT